MDGIINNAGIIQPFARLADLDLAAIRRVIDVNLYGTLNMIQAFLPHLRARPTAHIANVSSMGAYLPVPGQSIYCATKAAVKMIGEALHAELLDTNIRVSVVMPGAIATDIMTNSGVSARGMTDADLNAQAPSMTAPADAARMILDGIERDRLHVFAGKDARWMNVAVRIAPRRVPQLAARQILKQMAPLLNPPAPAQ